MSLAQRAEKLREELDIPGHMVEDLLAWAGVRIIVLADDSGSMNMVADVKTCTTRWEELRSTLKTLSQLLATVGSDGFFFQFFNQRSPIDQVQSDLDLETIFQVVTNPKGGTPLGARISQAIDNQAVDIDTLIMVFTDGEPSDVTFEGLRNMIRGKPPRVYFTFMMCTGDDDVVERYNRFIDPIPGVDVLDDYASEKREVERAGNRFNMNTYLVKAILGPKFSRYDDLDAPQSVKHCCSVQ